VVVGIGPGWDYCRCRLDGPNSLFCTVRMLRFYVQVRWIGHDILPLSVRGICRINTWGYGDRVGFLLVQVRWAEWPP